VSLGQFVDRMTPLRAHPHWCAKWIQQIRNQSRRRQACPGRFSMRQQTILSYKFGKLHYTVAAHVTAIARCLNYYFSFTLLFLSFIRSSKCLFF